MVAVAEAVDDAVAVGVRVRVGVRVKDGIGVAVGVDPARAASTAAYASTRPKPNALLGTTVVEIPPQVWAGLTMTAVLVVPSRIARVVAMSPTRSGRADHRRATAPATCGVAIEVPLQLA